MIYILLFSILCFLKQGEKLLTSKEYETRSFDLAEISDKTSKDISLAIAIINSVSSQDIVLDYTYNKKSKTIEPDNTRILNELRKKLKIYDLKQRRINLLIENDRKMSHLTKKTT